MHALRHQQRLAHTSSLLSTITHKGCKQRMESGKVYFLDLRTLLLYLHDQSCILSTKTRVNKKDAQGYIFLQAGEMTNCLLRFADGEQLQGQEAYEQIRACNQWQVDLNPPMDLRKAFQQTPPAFPPPVQPRSIREPFSPSLRPKRPFHYTMFQHLSAKERLIAYTVLTLIDGKRTSADIQTQLHLTSEEMDTALRQLRVLDLIE